MTTTSLQSRIEASSDPAVMLTADGVIEWRNAAFDAAVSAASELHPADLRAILATLRYGVIDELQTPALKALTAIVLAVEGDSPDTERFLAVFKSADPRMRSLNEREEFLGTVAHDIKNPIGAIFGYADALLDTPLGSSLEPPQRQVIQRVRATATRAIDLVRNYQHLAALQSGRTPLFKGAGMSYDLNQAVRSVLEFNVDEQEGQTASVRAILAEQPLAVKIERVALERIVANLISNALKFTPASGVITVTTGRTGTRAILEVANSEPLLSEEDRSNLFRKYWRGSRGSAVPGSGLGLYIVKLLSESAGGSVSARVGESEGNVFRVELPAA